MVTVLDSTGIKDFHHSESDFGSTGLEGEDELEKKARSGHCIAPGASSLRGDLQGRWHLIGDAATIPESTTFIPKTPSMC